MNAPQVFVAGTWRDDIPRQYREAAHRVGVLIAEAGCSLACGPGTGISAHAIAGFRSVTGRAGVVRFYLPAQRWMEAVGEVARWQDADEIVATDLDYPQRNVYQISKSSGVVAITGGDGTLEEILPALIDYGLPVAVLQGSGQAAVALERLLDVFPAWRPSVLLDDDPASLSGFVLDRLRLPG